MQHTIRTTLLAAAMGIATCAAHAATDTQAFSVMLTVTESCTISATPPTDVNFGSNARTSGAVSVTANGTLHVNCSPGTEWVITLNEGQHNDGTSRRMQSTTNIAHYAAYGLYQDAGYGTPWGNVTNFGSGLAGTGTGTSQDIPVYGRLTNLNLPAGNYVDSVTATITY